MTHETARVLATALMLQRAAVAAIAEMCDRDLINDPRASPELEKLCEVYVHEQRIVNRIVREHRDE